MGFNSVSSNSVDKKQDAAKFSIVERKNKLFSNSKTTGGFLLDISPGDAKDSQPKTPLMTSNSK